MSPAEESLLRRVAREQRKDFVLPIHLDLAALLSLVGGLQLSLRHPKNTGPTAEVTQEFIAQVIERLDEENFPAHAELMRMGNDPEKDR